MTESGIYHDGMMYTILQTVRSAVSLLSDATIVFKIQTLRHIINFYNYLQKVYQNRGAGLKYSLHSRPQTSKQRKPAPKKSWTKSDHNARYTLVGGDLKNLTLGHVPQGSGRCQLTWTAAGKYQRRPSTHLSHRGLAHTLTETYLVLTFITNSLRASEHFEFMFTPKW